MSEIDTTNYSLVGTNGDDIVFIRPLPQRLTKERALNLAAYLVAMADDNNQFPAILEAVQNT